MGARWRGTARTVLGSLLLLAGALGLFLLIRSVGEGLSAPAGTGQPVGSAAAGDALLHVLLTLAAVLALGQVLSRLLALLWQPPVMGEMLAGILLGPSLLGSEGAEWLLPKTAAPLLGVLAQLGVILYMFLVGLDLNARLLRRHARAAVGISQAGIVVPFLLGTALALGLYPRLAPPGVPFTSFSLFLGISLSITAFPVLARILADLGLMRTELGVVALGCAAADDATGWCLLALVVGVAQAAVGAGLTVAVGTLGFFVGLLLLVRPALRPWLRADLPESALQRRLPIIYLLLLLSALATEWIGIHAIFGAFLFGALIPHDCPLARALVRQMHGLVTILLLPAFFAFTGMRTRIDLMTGGEDWLLCGLIVLAAVAGKFGGVLVAARVAGLHWRLAAALGALMNTRGLMELVVLNIGLDLGVLSPALFAMMVIMALATTLMTAPLVRLLVGVASAAATRAPLPCGAGTAAEQELPQGAGHDGERPAP
jgi:Kef-type K+ transport system membrane component KefB